MSVTYATKKAAIYEGHGTVLTVTSTTGSETSASLPANTTSGDDSRVVPGGGLPLGPMAAVDILVQATTGTFSAGATLQAYLWDAYQKAWVRCPDYDRNVTEGLAAQAFSPLKVECPLGWLIFLPDTLGVANTITLVGRFRGATRVG